jgi:DNA-binding XRE family transcriptional regulator
MIRTDLLNGEIARAGLTKPVLARMIGMAPKTFYNKEKKGVFGSDEIVKIVTACQIQDPVRIFFPEFVAQHET